MTIDKTKKNPSEIIDAILKVLKDELESGNKDFIQASAIATKIDSQSTTVIKYLELIELIKKSPSIEVARSAKIIFARMKSKEVD